MKLRRLTIALLLLYLLLTLSPAFSVAAGASPFNWLTPVATLIGFAFTLLHAGQREGWRRALLLLGSVFVISLLFESVGVATGLVYGPYHYTDKLGPLFLGLVPYLIPVAWFMMSYPSFVIADRLVPAGWKRWLRILAVSALGGMVMTAWDVVMDPMMVAGGHWVWEVNGAYHGIPLQNFAGWWVTVFISFLVYQLVAGKTQLEPDRAFDRLPVLSYLTTAAGTLLALLAAGSGELVLIGTFTMLPWVIAGWLRLAKE